MVPRNLQQSFERRCVAGIDPAKVIVLNVERIDAGICIQNVKIIGSSWKRVDKFEGLKGLKARYFGDILYFCRFGNLAEKLDEKNIETPSAALGYVFV